MINGKPDPAYEIQEAQLQFWVDIGTIDNAGLGTLTSIKESHPFPSRKLAERWLDDNGWLWDEQLLRRSKKCSSPYLIVRVRQVLEHRFEKWI